MQPQKPPDFAAAQEDRSPEEALRRKQARTRAAPNWLWMEADLVRWFMQLPADLQGVPPFEALLVRFRHPRHPSGK